MVCSRWRTRGGNVQSVQAWRSVVWRTSPESLDRGRARGRGALDEGADHDERALRISYPGGLGNGHGATESRAQISRVWPESRVESNICGPSRRRRVFAAPTCHYEAIQNINVLLHLILGSKHYPSVAKRASPPAC